MSLNPRPPGLALVCVALRKVELAGAKISSRAGESGSKFGLGQIGQLQNSLDSKSTEAGALRGYAMVQLFARCWGGILVLLIELNVGLNRLPFACWVETRGEIEKKKTKTQKSQCVRG